MTDTTLSRLSLVDALRGFALMGLFGLHVIDHYELYWLDPSPDPVHDFLSFLIAGKAYAIFALMFGLSFFIIMDRAQRRGVDFSARFAWRMALLGVLGLLHGVIFVSDILQVLSMAGLLLLGLNRLPTRWLFGVAGMALIQPDLIVKLILSLSDPSANALPFFATHNGLETYATGTFAQVVAENTSAGFLRKWDYMIQSGRLVQIIGLFTLGLCLGRIGFFSAPERFAGLRLWLLIGCGIAVFALHMVWPFVTLLIPGDGLHQMVPAWRDSLYMLYGADLMVIIYVVIFIEFYRLEPMQRVLGLLVPAGRMTLTLYVGQSLIFVPLFYGFGAGLYANLDASRSAILALIGMGLQIGFAHLWFRHFAYGPLEWLWRAGTMMTLKVPFRASKIGQ